MAITIEDPEVERLARALAEAQGVSVNEAVAEALRARLRDGRAGAAVPTDTPPMGHRRDAWPARVREYVERGETQDLEVKARLASRPEDPAVVTARGRAMREVLDKWYAEQRTLPTRDARTLEEMLYDDEYGLPK